MSDVTAFAERIPAKKAAALLGVHLVTLRTWCEDGRIAHFRIGSRRYFDPAELDRFIQKCHRPCSQDAV